MERLIGTVSRGVRAPIVREGDNIVNLGNGYMNLSTTNTDKATLNISYSNEELQPTHISIVMTSSRQGDLFIGAKGSTLTVDNVVVNY